MNNRLIRLRIWEQVKYLNYNDVYASAVPRIHPPLSQPPVETVFPAVELALVRPAGELRKKIQNYSFLITDKIGKGYSSVVYKGVNDLTGISYAI